VRGGLCRGVAWFLYLYGPVSLGCGVSRFTRRTAITRILQRARWLAPAEPDIAISLCLVSRETEFYCARRTLPRSRTAFVIVESNVPRLRGFQIYTQYERCATSSARAVAGAIRARSSQYHDVSCIVQRNLNVLADFAAVSHGFCT